MTQNARAFNWDSIPVKTATTANPAAGAQPPTITVAAATRMKFYGFRFSVVTDANVANRTVYVSIAPDGANTIYYSLASNQPESTTHYYNLAVARSTTEILVGTSHYIGVSAGTDGIDLSAGATIIVSIGTIQVGDDATAITYFYKEAPA